ncbi:MAG TPA: OmpA family protein [Gammaproteobacteria bacterium]|nr:OmpA family protein [Gammaproteobacteria bacterium]
MNMRLIALTVSTALLAACQSAPSPTAWLMQDGAPWVGPDGQCLQLRPLKQDEKQGFCYDVMTGAYQKQHHYEQLDPAEFAFLYPKVEPTPALQPPLPELNAPLAAVNIAIDPLPGAQQIYTSLPFKFNNAHLSHRNRVALKESFEAWKGQGIQVTSVTVTGHTDSKGSQAYNLLLSKWRAQSVAYYLAHIGIPKDDISHGGAGKLVPNPNGHSDADNRYVDLRVWLLPPVEKLMEQMGSSAPSSSAGLEWSTGY